MGEVSAKSVSRFVRLWLQIEKPDAYFHQTLTFPPPQRDFVYGKQAVGKLLDNLHHRFVMASLYVAGRQRSGALHYHILFFFYTPVSRLAQTRFKQAVWAAWQNLQAGACVRDANKFLRSDEFFNDRLRAIGYFSKEVRKLKGRWWGVRNYKLVREHSRTVTRAEVKLALESLSTRPQPQSQPAKSKFTMKNVLSMRERIDFEKKLDWETFKQRKTGLDRKVSDRAFLDFLNGDADRRIVVEDPFAAP